MAAQPSRPPSFAPAAADAMDADERLRSRANPAAKAARVKRMVLNSTLFKEFRWG